MIRWGWIGQPARLASSSSFLGAIQEWSAQEGIPRTGFEFQMLRGVRRDLQLSLAQAGWGVRCYVPFGTEWYPYFMRRLAERPANVWFVVKNCWKDSRAAGFAV